MEAAFAKCTNTNIYLKDEALELVKYIKGKGNMVEIQDKEVAPSGGREKVAGARKGIK